MIKKIGSFGIRTALTLLGSLVALREAWAVPVEEAEFPFAGGGGGGGYGLAILTGITATVLAVRHYFRKK